MVAKKRRNIKRQEMYDYNFDLNNEKKLYDGIGCNEKKEKTKKHFKWKTSGDKMHNDKLNTYLEWKTYVEEKLPKESINLNNMKRFLNRKKRNAERNLDIYKTIVTPAYITMITLFVSIEVEPLQGYRIRIVNLYFAFFVLVTIIIILIIIYFRESCYIAFYEDYMEIIQEKLDCILDKEKGGN